MTVWVAVIGGGQPGDDSEVVGVFISAEAAKAAHPFARVEEWDVEGA